MALTNFRRITVKFCEFLFWRLTYAGPNANGTVERAGAKIFYKTLGEGPTMLLLHGGLSSNLDWFSQIPFFIRRGWRLILIDTRGHGASTLSSEALTYQHLAKDVIAVLEALKIQQCHVMGWSDGGNTALRLSEQYPAKVSSMVLISANYSPTGLKDPKLENFNNTRIHRLKRWLLRSGSDELVIKVKRLWQNHPKMTTHDLRAIHVPTLVLIGENDEISITHANVMAEALPLAEINIIRGARHHALMTHADEVNHRSRKFFLKHTAGHARPGDFE